MVQHLKSCAKCSDECAQMGLVMGELRESATAAAEYHRQRAVVGVVAQPRVSRMAWAMATAVLFLGVATPVALRTRGGGPVVVKAPVTQISDEALLNGIQNDLSSSVPEPLQALASTASPTNASTTSSIQRKN